MIHRELNEQLLRHLGRGKSILLLGPRQVGKTTLLKSLSVDHRINFSKRAERLLFEKNPEQLGSVVRGLGKKRPLIVVDEVQKVPAILDEAQSLIDDSMAQFIFTGSSARKLRKTKGANWLPGRVVNLRLDPLHHQEIPRLEIEHHLTYGSLPAIALEPSKANKAQDLRSYVESYLEEEVRAEALVRDLAHFARFLELAAIESGRIVNFTAVSQDVGVSAHTIMSYYEILTDCLVAERIEPMVQSLTRKKLTRSPRFLFFDIGVQRVCAGEGVSASPTRMGELFEAFIGLELLRWKRLRNPEAQIMFWRDPGGPEVDWLVKIDDHLIPIETKWTKTPRDRDMSHLRTFLSEYSNAKVAVVVCRTPQRLKMKDNIWCLPWNEMFDFLDKTLESRSK